MSDVLNPHQKALVEKNLDLAHFLARLAWSKNREELDIEEVVSIAYQGLIKAAQQFDPSKMSAETLENGKAFGAYARVRITGTILDWQRETDHVQRRWRISYKQLLALGYSKPQNYSREAMQVYADKLELPLEKLLTIVRSVESPAISLNRDYRSFEPGDSVSAHSQWVDGGWWEDDSTPSVESSMVENQIVLAVQQAHAELPELQKVVIAMRWYENDEFQTIASKLGVSLNIVREAHSEALQVIHRAMVHSAAVHH